MPARRRDLIATDPTSPRSMMLQAMLRDDTDSVFLGRPCYYQVTDPLCVGRWWTSHRYAPEVVASLMEIVERLAGDQRELWLIGHSGGGSLAVLVGRRLKRQVNVLTLAANLDHARWTDHHGFTPLTGSINPIDDDARNPAMRELHWYGTGDSVIFADWIRDFCRRHGARCEAANASHAEGWLEQWPSLLERSAAIFEDEARAD